MNSGKVAFIFFAILFLTISIFSVFWPFLLYDNGGFFGSFFIGAALVRTIPTFIITFLVSLTIYFFVKSRNISQLRLYVTFAFVWGALLLVLIAMELPIQFFLSPVFCLSAIYFLGKVRKSMLSAPIFPLKDFMVRGFLLSIFVLSAALIATSVNEFIRGSGREAKVASEKKLASETIKISEWRDSVLFSSNKNPIGIRLQYNVTVSSKWPHKFSERSLDEKFYAEGPDGRIESIGSDLVTRRTIFKAFPDNKLNKEKKYEIIQYIVPDYVSEFDYELFSPFHSIREDGIVNLQEWCYAPHVGRESILEFLKDNDYTYTSAIGGYSGALNDWLLYITTKNKYNPKIFYESLIKENVPNCPRSY